jgi:2-dehydropantoate 2-reductase
MLTERGSNLSASMRRDLEAGSRTEGNQILGDMLRRARARGIATPLLGVTVCHLQVHDRGLAARR